ncbi:hypothetical protein I3843_12G141800 [Carya illinoinensis]|nr:hypothetical protein I3843_12G141800 [Carya illinoinensis]KAG7954072.1 hypothetical protein I3843_12G141800 [Carya illinoinensis]
MLSIENSPPDPSCPCDVSQLKTGSDEGASHYLPLPEVDLSKPAPFGETPLPRFSIRDYVFITRSKDIKTNWPFSSKSLHLCLKHGVKDVLPPFQPLDKVKNKCFQRCTVQSSAFEDKNLSYFDGEPSGSDDHAILDLSINAQLNRKPAKACIETTSCRSEGDCDFPSTITSLSRSDIESLPTNRLSSPSIDADTLPEDSVEVAAAGPALKAESPTRPSSKKCRLVVKFCANSDRSSTEDISSNCISMTELTMASKICPVCKTFSSSSNTTLNAHIDQCLSMESTPKWMADSKLTKHRIKPRKMRLMVDIYAMAARCTLEELDRRNGTSWATVSRLPTQDNDKSEMPAEGNKQKMLPVNTADTGDVGTVYIDASGTKLRILSKFDGGPSASQVAKDLGARKPSKGGKGSKSFSTKKKKCCAPKHHKYLKLAPQSKKILSHKAHSSQIYRVQGVYHGVEERCKKKKCPIKKQVKSSDSGNLRRWVCSKRTGVAKKVKRKDDHQLPSESDHFCYGNSLMERSQVSKLAKLSQNPIYSSEKGERMKNSFCEARASDKRERSPGRKRLGSPLFGSSTSGGVKSSLPLMKRQMNQLTKDSDSVCDGCILKSPKSTGNYVSLLRSELDDIAAGPSHSSDIPLFPSTYSYMSHHSLTSKTMGFSSSRENVLAVKGRSSVTESSPDAIKKCSAFRTSRVHLTAEIGEKVAAWYSEAGKQHDLMHNLIDKHSGREEISRELSFGSSTALKLKQDRDSISISQRQEAMALKSSQLAPQCYGHGEGEHMDSSVRVDDFMHKVYGSRSDKKEIWIPEEDIFTEPAPKDVVQDGYTNLFESVDLDLQHKLENFTDNQSNSLQSVEDCQGPLCGDETPSGPSKPTLFYGKDIYSADKEGHGFIGKHVHVVEEVDFDVGQANFFAEVDPIPIPGPPGSFLPSPRGMGSEDLQGNSSLTTSRVQSSLDQHDFIDQDSSDSPISAASTLSNSTVTGYDQNYSEPFSSVGTQSVQEKMSSGFSVASIRPSAESVSIVPQMTTPAVEKITFDGENSKINKTSIEKGPLSFRSDEPCCCQRKERTSQGFALNYQESQLLKRRAIASVTLPTLGKQMGCNLNTRPGNSDVMPEIFSLNSCLSSKSEKVAPPIIKSPAGPISFKCSPDAGVKFPGHGNCDSASPSASNPILRLMGKNLMVVNKDEDASMPLVQAEPHPNQLNSSTPRFPTFSEVSPVNIQNQAHCSNHHMVSQIGQDSHELVGPCFDGRLSNSFRRRTTKPPQLAERGPAGLFPDQPQDGGFIALMESREYKGHYHVPAEQNKSKNRPIYAPTYNMQKCLTMPDYQQMSARSAVNANREIIMVDDIAASEANLTTDVTKYSAGLRESKVVSSGIPIPMISDYNSRDVNSLSYYQSQDHSLLGELPAVPKASFHAIPSRGANASSARWSCTSEGSSVLQQSPFFAASSSTGHLRSALYNSPSLT